MGVLHKKEKQYKDFLKVYNRLSEVRNEISKLPYKKLDKPYHRGFVKFYVIRKDILRSEIGPIKKRCLDVVQRSVWNFDDSFITGYAQWNIHESDEIIHTKKGKKILKHPMIVPISEKHYESLDPQMQKQFRKETKLFWGNVEKVTYRWNYQPWELKEVIKKSWVTHEKEIDPELEREYDELHTKFIYYLNTGVAQRKLGSMEKWEKKLYTRKKIHKSLRDIEHVEYFDF